MTNEQSTSTSAVLLTGGADRPYAYGLSLALAERGVTLEVVGNDDLDCPELRNHPRLKFLNLRGDQDPNAGLVAKALRVLKYYARLLAYTTVAEPRIFHILWNNKFEVFDRTLLMLWYRIRGKRVVLTLHNINSRQRDGGDSFLNRFTLRIQYALAHHLFVHTEKMKEDLKRDFGVREARISVIPFGINNSVPVSDMTSADARRRLGIAGKEKVLLFYGNIAPYKGLEFLTRAFQQLASRGGNYRLVIAGKPKNCEKYWDALRSEVSEDIRNERIILREEYIPDEETEMYFKACDVLVLPYRYIYQSGVLFLGYSFGLPVLAANVGSLTEDIVEGKTGFVFQPKNADDLAKGIDRYFSSELYRNLDRERDAIRAYAEGKHSWAAVAQTTVAVYMGLLSSAHTNLGATAHITDINPT